MGILGPMLQDLFKHLDLKKKFTYMYTYMYIYAYMHMYTYVLKEKEIFFAT